MLVTSLINILEKYFSNSGDFLYQTEHHCHKVLEKHYLSLWKFEWSDVTEEKLLTYRKHKYLAKFLTKILSDCFCTDTFYCFSDTLSMLHCFYVG